MFVLGLQVEVVVGREVGVLSGVTGAGVGVGVGDEVGLTTSTATGFGVASTGVIFGTAGVADLRSAAIRLVAAGEKSSETSSFSTSLIRMRLLEMTGGFDGSDAGDSCFLVVVGLATGFEVVVAVAESFVTEGFAVDDGVAVVDPCFSFASSSLTALLTGSIVSAVSKSFLASSTLPSDRRAIPRLQSAFTFLLSSFSPNVQSRSASSNLWSNRYYNMMPLVSSGDLHMFFVRSRSTSISLNTVPFKLKKSHGSVDWQN